MPRTYLWQAANWPTFSYSATDLDAAQARAAEKYARLQGILDAIGLSDRERAEVLATTEEAVTTSAIEGEILDPEATRSSVANQLGLAFGGARPPDRKSKGVVDMLVDASQNFSHPLTNERLCYWQSHLFDGNDANWVGRYRTAADGHEQIVEGPYGAQRVLYEAPPGEQVPREMVQFVKWFNQQPLGERGFMHSAIAHLWFVSIHPFVDGNGRVARALSDLAFARAEKSGHRYFSMSSQILRDRKEYEEALQSVQRGRTLDITEWMLWFGECYERALDHAIQNAKEAIERATFWARHADVSFNERQRKVLQRVLGEWKGNLTARKWVTMTGVSSDTAQRDLQELVDAGIMQREGAGRGTHYVLVTE